MKKILCIKKEKGITLLALVITIIVLVILAAVSINLLLGDQGIITRAKEAKQMTEIADIKTNIQLEIIDKQLEDENGNISEDTLKEILEKYGVLSEEGEKLIAKTLTTTKGNYEIKVADIFNGTTVKDEVKAPATLPEVLEGANSPDISGFNVENTHYVTWGTTAPYQISELNQTNTIDKAPPSGWSNYTEKQWANIVTSGGGNECYWVWIPRYAYKITNGTVKVVFLQGRTNKDMNGNDVTSSTYVDAKGSSGAYKVHPAFTQTGNGQTITNADGSVNTNYVGNGGFGELTGIWVAKYEASSSSATDLTNVATSEIPSKISNNGGGDTANLQIRVVPNVTSWRQITVGNIFTVCQNLTKTVTVSGEEKQNSLVGTTNLDAHMMKNTEWGAVAYLSRSIYGKNSEVWRNPYHNNNSNCSPITGLCSKNTEEKDEVVTDTTRTCKYNEVGGGNASTTGNVYGIYDMVGGAWESVAGILSSYKSKSNNYDFSNSVTYPNKYFDWYAGSSNDGNTNYNANSAKYGDAVYEVKSSVFNGFPKSDTPVFIRGGRAGVNVDGVFDASSAPGQAGPNCSFRPVILSSQP